MTSLWEPIDSIQRAPQILEFLKRHQHQLNQEPKKDNLNNSAPLKTFRSVIENFAEVPTSLMLECVNSVSNPKVYFSMGDKRMLIFNSSSFNSSNWMLVDLKLFKDFK